MPCRSVPEGGLVPGGLQFSGGSPIFGGVEGGPPIFLFWGGKFFLISDFFGDTLPPGTRHRNTVNVRSVRILLECILVIFNIVECLKCTCSFACNKSVYPADWC